MTVRWCAGDYAYWGSGVRISNFVTPFYRGYSGCGQRLDRDIFYQGSRLHCLRGLFYTSYFRCFPVGPGGCLSYSCGEMTRRVGASFYFH